MKSTSLLAFLVAMSVLACGDGSGVATAADKAPYRIGERLPQGGAPAAAAAYKETTWEALVPADWNPGKELGNLDLGALNDADPRAMKALEQMRNAWNNAPIVAALNGSRIRIPGFIVRWRTSVARSRSSCWCRTSAPVSIRRRRRPTRSFTSCPSSR